MLVLVDGYNVTMADPAMAGRSKEQQRDALCARLRVLAASIAPGGRVTVVFDAHSALTTTAEDVDGVGVLYASSADAEIARRCAEARGNVTVYTNDMRLRARISQDVGRHVVYRDASLLFVPTRPDSAAPRGATARLGDSLPAGEKRAITDELADIWGVDDE